MKNEDYVTKILEHVGPTIDVIGLFLLVKKIQKDEREALEAELLKLKKGIASNSDYIQGRWDLIGEFQDVIRASGHKGAVE